MWRFGAAAASSYILNFKSNSKAIHQKINTAIQLSTMTSLGSGSVEKEMEKQNNTPLQTRPSQELHLHNAKNEFNQTL